MPATNNQAALAAARELFEKTFGEVSSNAKVLAVHAPGRSEISGNHTDHEGGHVIAGALDVAVDGVAVANGTNVVRIIDANFPLVEVDLSDLSVREDERETTAALVRGMAFELAQTGRTPAGFDFASICSVPAGGGLSSSAAVEAAYGRAMEALWEGPSIDPVELAKMSQFAENRYFGKPCGLMDQAAVCLGGLAYMDFEVPSEPKTAKLDFDFDKAGYALCLVKVGSDHADLTFEYAAIPDEMQAIAGEFGCKRLCEVDPAVFDAAVPQLREKYGDRAVLRAIHYWYENGLVDKRWEDLVAGDIESFLVHTRASGASPPCSCKTCPQPLATCASSTPCWHWAWPSASWMVVGRPVFTAAALAARSSALSRLIWWTSSSPAWTRGWARGRAVSIPLPRKARARHGCNQGRRTGSYLLCDSLRADRGGRSPLGVQRAA